MSMLKRWRQRWLPRPPAGDALNPDLGSFSASIPAGRHGALCQLDLQWVREPQQDGERLRLRAHIQTNLASVLRPALRSIEQTPAGASGGPAALRSDSHSRKPARRAVQQAAQLSSRGLQKLMAIPLAQRLAEPLLRHDFNTWVDIQASTEPLDQGAHSLVPAREQLAALGIQARKGKGAIAESWSGHTPAGHAQLSLVQINKSDLPPELASKLGDQPFQLAAAFVNTMDRK